MFEYRKFEYDSSLCVNDLQVWELRVESRGTMQSGYIFGKLDVDQSSSREDVRSTR